MRWVVINDDPQVANVSSGPDTSGQQYLVNTRRVGDTRLWINLTILNVGMWVPVQNTEHMIRLGGL